MGSYVALDIEIEKDEWVTYVRHELERRTSTDPVEVLKKMTCPILATVSDTDAVGDESTGQKFTPAVLFLRPDVDASAMGHTRSRH